MAAGQALVSGSWRLSSTSGLFTQSFSALVNVSATFVTEFVLLPGVSDFVVSFPTMSNCNAIAVQADNQVRLNFGNTGGDGNVSYVSNASAGILVTQFAWVTGGTSGARSLRFANSGTNSATVRMIMCTS